MCQAFGLFLLRWAPRHQYASMQQLVASILDGWNFFFHSTRDKVLAEAGAK
jgi:hypothetical protein